jgi:hypothetical protein
MLKWSIITVNAKLSPVAPRISDPLKDARHARIVVKTSEIIVQNKEPEITLK